MLDAKAPFDLQNGYSVGGMREVEIAGSSGAECLQAVIVCEAINESTETHRP